MRISDLSLNNPTRIYEVINDEHGDEFQWEIEPTNLQILPDSDGTFIVRSFYAPDDHQIVDCFLLISMPERIADFVFFLSANNELTVNDYFKYSRKVIPAVASECYGNYELYYLRNNPELGIQVLSYGLNIAKNKWVVAQDIGYIQRDEGFVEKAIEAFRMVESVGEVSEDIYKEIAVLYGKLGDNEMKEKYELKVKR